MKWPKNNEILPLTAYKPPPIPNVKPSNTFPPTSTPWTISYPQKDNHGLLTRSSTKLLAPFPESGPNDASVGSANCGTFFLCSNQGSGCPPFSELQQLSGCVSLVLSRWNTVCTVFPEASRLPGSVIQLPSFWIWNHSKRVSQVKRQGIIAITIF